MTASLTLPTKPNRRAVTRLASVLNEQLPPDWEAFVRVDLIVDARPRAIVPDIVVAPEDDAQNVPASQALIAIDVISRASCRTDKYSEAGIPHYWVIDLEPPISLTAYRLAGPVYDEAPAVAGVFQTTEPFPLRIDLDRLVSRRSEGGNSR